MVHAHTHIIGEVVEVDLAVTEDGGCLGLVFGIKDKDILGFFF